MNETNLSYISFMIVVFVLIIMVVLTVAFFVVRRIFRRAKEIERSLKMVPLLIKLPPAEAAEASARDNRELIKENIARAEGLFNIVAAIGSTKTKSFLDYMLGLSALKRWLFGRKHLAFELVASEGRIFFYVIVPVSLLSTIEKALLASYHDVQIEKCEDHNIFSATGKIGVVAGGELVMTNNSWYPVQSYKNSEFDAIAAIVTSVSNLRQGEGAALQVLVRSSSKRWSKKARRAAKKLLHPGDKKHGGGYTAADMAKMAYKSPNSQDDQNKASGYNPPDAIDQKKSQLIEEKASSPTYEVMIRLIASSDDQTRSSMIIQDMMTGFAQLNLPGYNGFKLMKSQYSQTLASNYIFRIFPTWWNKVVLSATELATIYHLPSKTMESATPVERAGAREVAAPQGMSNQGLIFGSNMFHGQEQVVKLSDDDRRRHVYIIGQTGTGKSTILHNLIVQDMAMGKGLCFIDPHGDTAEEILAKVPANRAEDVIYFNPADTQMPLGMNILEFNRPEQKDFIIQETISMLYKLYDPEHQGIIGPRFEQWYRNAALTLMADPAGATFIEVPKIFTDNDYLKRKFKYVTDPIVQDFWIKEMGQTSDYHKSEMLGWFNSKFGAFAQNEILRNIIGQPKSSLDLRKVMDEGKILIVNLSKGMVGELNSKLLGMIFVIKIQAAAMSRSDIPEEQRRDFSLYVDEFQNFSTDSFATILSEARKYHLSLIVANQFIGQLNEQIRDAVFGNVGSILSYRVGPEDAEFLAKQLTPTFDAADIINIPNHRAAMRIISRGAVLTPFSIRMLPKIGQADANVQTAVKELSRTKYGRPKEDVERMIFDSLSINRSQGSAAAPPPKATQQSAASQAPLPATELASGSVAQSPSVPSQAAAAATQSLPVAQDGPNPSASIPGQDAASASAQPPNLVSTPSAVSAAPATDA